MIRIIRFASSRLTLKAKLLLGLAVVAAVAMATMLLLALIGVALIVVPVMLVGGLVYGLLPGRRPTPARIDSPGTLKPA